MYQIQKVTYSNSAFSYAPIYDQSRMNELSVIGPKCSLEVSEPGSLTFSLALDYPMLDYLEPLATYVRALDDGTEIFYGRILDKSDPTLTGHVIFTCEGALSFLLDSEIPPYGKDSNGNQITRTLAAKDFFEYCITSHNLEVDDPRRMFEIGIISAAQKDKVGEYSISQYIQTKSAIESELLDVYGGFIRVRPKNGGGHYIDWIENYETVNPQAIGIGVNLEDQTNHIDANSLFTFVRPIGKDGLTLSGTKEVQIYSNADVAKYGRIVKSIEFSNVSTEADLRTEVNNYVSRMKKTLFVTSNIKMVDMHYIDGTMPKVRLGDRFTNIRGLIGQEMIASSIELNFESPQDDSFDLKNRKSLDPDLTPEGNRHKSRTLSHKTGKANKASTQTFKYLQEIDDMLEVTANTVYMHGETLTQHYQRIEQNASYYESISSRVQTAEQIQAEEVQKINDIEYHIRTIEGTGGIQTAQFISQLAGKFEIWTDPLTNDVTVHLVNGTELAVDDANGGTITVGTRLEQVASDVNGVKTIIDSLSGSALWTQQNQIVGVCGEYDVQYQQVEDPDHPGQYITVKTLVVKSGGGMKIRKDNVEYGLYMTDDGGNTVLTGGLMVDKINGQTTTKIRGDRVDIEATDISISATQTLESVVGHFEEEIYSAYEDGNLVSRKRLVYKADGGMIVERKDDNGAVVSVGLFDEGNLTGGVMVQKINGQAVTHIKGSKVLVGDDLQDGNLPDWASDAEGLIATKATINSLNAVDARVSTLEANYVNATNIRSKIGDIDNLVVKGIAGSTTSSSATFDSFVGHDFKVSFSGGGNQTYTRSLCDGIYDLQIVAPASGSNTYTLQKKAIGDSTWTNVGTFSRATTLTGEQKSGGVFEVKATPQGDTYHVIFPVTQPSSFSNSISITTANGNYNYYMDNDTDDIVKLYTTYNGSTVNVAKYTHGKYTAGWGAAKNSCHNKTYTVSSRTYNYNPTVTVSSGRLQYIRVATPNSTVDGSLISTSYYVTSDDNDAYIRYGSTTGAIVASVNHGKYNAGWGAAKNSCHNKTYTVSSRTYNYNPTVTVSSGRLQYIRVATPNSTVDGSLISTSYYVTSDDNDAYIRYGSTTGAIVASVNHGKYNAGWNDGYDEGYDEGYDAGYDANAGFGWYEPDGQKSSSSSYGYSEVGSVSSGYSYYAFRIRTSRGSKWYQIHILH